jgi:hypothetical protein
MNRRQMVGAVVAMAAAGLVLTSTMKADDAPAKTPKKTVKCMGGNACKGKGACAAADGSHSCAGQNGCKGKGWIMTATDKECTDAGGKVVKPKKKGGEEEKKPS